MAQFDIQDYDRYIVSFSGGKDSTATFLYLLDHGIPREKIELWHQDIDGRERNFFDWEVTPDYCRRFAHAFGVKIYFQWKEGGFYREMMRENSLTAPNCYELPDGTVGRSGGTRGTPNTRLRFPQAAADLRTRWCSSYLKIDVCSAAIVNQSRFNNIRTLILSGERGGKKVPSGQNMPSGNRTGRTAGTGNITVMLTAIVPFVTGRKRRFGKPSNVTGFGRIHVTTWDGAAVPVGSASSATKTNSPALPQSARNAFRKSPCWNNNSGVPSNGNVTFCPSSEPALRIITLPKHGKQ